MQNLTDLNIEKYRDNLHELAQLKSNPLELLYNNRAKLYMKFKEAESIFDVYCVECVEKLENGKINSEYEPDCKVSSYTENIYFRTNKGMNVEKYKSFPLMLREINKRAKTLGYTIESYKVELREQKY
jgi:hypothetical protein